MPALASHEALEWGNAGVMAVVSELASGVAGLARTLAVGRDNGYRAGQYYCTCTSTLWQTHSAFTQNSFSDTRSFLVCLARREVNTIGALVAWVGLVGHAELHRKWQVWEIGLEDQASPRCRTLRKL